MKVLFIGYERKDMSFFGYESKGIQPSRKKEKTYGSLRHESKHLSYKELGRTKR